MAVFVDESCQNLGEKDRERNREREREIERERERERKKRIVRAESGVVPVGKGGTHKRDPGAQRRSLLVLVLLQGRALRVPR